MSYRSFQSSKIRKWNILVDSLLNEINQLKTVRSIILILKLCIRNELSLSKKETHRLGSMLIFSIKKIMAILNVKY